MWKMFESLPVSGPQNSMTSVAVRSARSVMNAFCISEVQHKAKRGCIGFHSEFAALTTRAHTHTHTDTKYKGWTQYTNICSLEWVAGRSLTLCYLLYGQRWGSGCKLVRTFKLNAIQCTTVANLYFIQQLSDAAPREIMPKFCFFFVFFYKGCIILLCLPRGWQLWGVGWAMGELLLPEWTKGV